MLLNEDAKAGELGASPSAWRAYVCHVLVLADFADVDVREPHNAVLVGLSKSSFNYECVRRCRGRARGEKPER